MSERKGERDDGPLLRIGELSRRTGVHADTLRAWERRYGLLSPARSDGGFRLYSGEDEERVRAMRALIDSGLSAAEAARLARSGAVPSPSPGAASLRTRTDGCVRRLSASTRQRRTLSWTRRSLRSRWRPWRAALCCRRLRRSASAGSAERRPWGRSTSRPTSYVGASPAWRATGAWASGPLAILACPPGELHDIGLLVFGLVLRARGWRIAYLGANTPIASVAEAAERLAPRVVVLAALTEEPFALGRGRDRASRRAGPGSAGRRGRRRGVLQPGGCRAPLRGSGRRGGAAGRAGRAGDESMSAFERRDHRRRC